MTDIGFETVRQSGRGSTVSRFLPELRVKQDWGDDLKRMAGPHIDRTRLSYAFMACKWSDRGWKKATEVYFRRGLRTGGDCPDLPFCVDMLGPIVYTFGNEQQKRDILPQSTNQRELSLVGGSNRIQRNIIFSEILSFCKPSNA